MYGPKRVAGEFFQRSMNSEVQEILQEKDIVKAIKIQRLQWYGQIKRIEEEKVLRKVTEWKLDFRRSRGRSKSRWEEQVFDDIKRLRIHKWRGRFKIRNHGKESHKRQRRARH